MTRSTLLRVVGLLLASGITLVAATGCDETGKIGNGAKDKIQQGGNAGGSAGYP